MTLHTVLAIALTFIAGVVLFATGSLIVARVRRPRRAEYQPSPTDAAALSTHDRLAMIQAAFASQRNDDDELSLEEEQALAADISSVLRGGADRYTRPFDLRNTLGADESSRAWRSLRSVGESLAPDWDHELLQIALSDWYSAAQELELTNSDEEIRTHLLLILPMLLASIRESMRLSGEASNG